MSCLCSPRRAGTLITPARFTWRSPRRADTLIILVAEAIPLHMPATVHGRTVSTIIHVSFSYAFIARLKDRHQALEQKETFFGDMLHVCDNDMHGVPSAFPMLFQLGTNFFKFSSKVI